MTIEGKTVNLIITHQRDAKLTMVELYSKTTGARLWQIAMPIDAYNLLIEKGHHAHLRRMRRAKRGRKHCTACGKRYTSTVHPSCPHCHTETP